MQETRKDTLRFLLLYFEASFLEIFSNCFRLAFFNSTEFGFP